MAVLSRYISPKQLPLDLAEFLVLRLARRTKVPEHSGLCQQVEFMPYKVSPRFIPPFSMPQFIVHGEWR